METTVKLFFLLVMVWVLCVTITGIYETKNSPKTCEVCKAIASELEQVKAENLRIGKELDTIVNVNLELAKELHKEGVIPLEYFYNIQHNFKMVRE